MTEEASDRLASASPEEPWWDDVAIPALLTAARKSFGRSIAARLRQAGYPDVPPNGARVLGAILRYGPLPADRLDLLDIGEHQASRAVSTLLERRYLTLIASTGNEGDSGSGEAGQYRLTDQGEAAGRVVRASVDRVEETLVQRIGADDVRVLRRGLGVLTNLEVA